MLVLGMKQVFFSAVPVYLLLELPCWTRGQQTMCRTWSIKRTRNLAGCGRYRKHTCQSNHQPVCIQKTHLQLRSCLGLSVQSSWCSHAGLRSRVFVVGPSHHVYTRQCLLSVANAYSAPQGQVEIDQDIYSHLLQTGQFERMCLETDEAEHSLELQMPFIMHIMRGQPFKLVPIMVGAISPDREALYGRLLGPFLDDAQNLFVISSDFCHWGQRFGFTYHDIPKHGSISKSIQWLDELAMDIIEQGRPEAFTAYLEQYGNTICGRHPIGVLLNMLQHTQVGHVIRFQKYDQSAQCQSIRESSVSYAAAVMTIV